MRLYHDTVTVTEGVAQITVVFDPIHYETFLTKVEDVNEVTMEQYLLREIAEQWDKNVAYELNQFIEFVKRRIEREKR